MSRPTPLRAAAVLVLALTSTACASTVDRMARREDGPPMTGTRRTPTEQFGVQVAQTADAVQLLPRAGALSPGQVQALTDLAGRYQTAGQGSIRIDTPAGGQNAAVASQAAYAAQQVLQGAGVSPGAILMSAYNATGHANPTVSVGFSRYVANVPDCAQYVGDFTRTGGNEPYRSFGCSQTANMAVQVANPGDFIAPAAEGPPDAGRRSVVMGVYRSGKPTGTPRSGNPAEAVTASEF